jgi:hypothetical protein
MNRQNAFAIVAALAVGYWLASSPAPKPDRPVVRFVSRIAKNFLWVALLAERPPAEPQPDHQVSRAARIGDDGYPVVDNARGW